MPSIADYLPFDPGTSATYVFLLVIGIALASVMLQNRLSEKTKKVLFAITAASVAAVTLYIAGSTVFLNLVSESQGPVHWHADFEIWVCGEKITSLASPVFPSNKVGSETQHHHDDYRMHVEGVVVKKEDVSLGKFFEAIGGELTKESITIPLNDGTKVTYKNGMKCPDGKEGIIRLLVMNSTTAGKLVEKPGLDEYVLSPHFSTVVEGAEGDLLMIVFGTGEETR